MTKKWFISFVKVHGARYSTFDPILTSIPKRTKKNKESNQIESKNSKMQGQTSANSEN